jgi:hypothetical protein
MSSIDEALKEAPPQDIMTNHLLDELLYYITPVISIIAFILIMIYGVIPNASSMSDKVIAVNYLITQDTEIKARIVKLEGIKNDLTNLQTTLSEIDSIVPEGKTEVVKFSQRIRDAINLNMSSVTGPAITMNDIKTGETQLTTATGSQVAGLTINQVPTQFTFSGGLPRFRQFFKNLYSGQDFFVVDKMNLSYDASSQQWYGDVSLVKYQFNVADTFNAAQIYGSVSENTNPNQKVIDFIQTKFVNNSL